jgi:hypothetical protein
MISQCNEDRVGLDIEMYRVPPISIDDIPQVLLCKLRCCDGGCPRKRIPSRTGGRAGLETASPVNVP